MNYRRFALVALLWCSGVVGAAGEPQVWRAERRIIDMHAHLGFMPANLDRAAKIRDEVGVGISVSLGTGTVTRGANGEPSQFERNKKLADERHPGRVLHYMILDYAGWDEDGWGERAAKQVEEGQRLGAAGLKEFKRLGLFQRDKSGKLLKIDDPKLDPVWAKCGELGMPISIHVADPKAFWEPFNDKNERWKELKDHRNWWFGDAARFPAWKELLEALNRVIEKHPKTTFVCVHFANCAEELEWVDASLSKHPNMMADLAARIPEVGRHDPEKVRALFIKHQDRIVFGTDFQVYDRPILGSSGNEPPPTDENAKVFFEKHWRFLETRDRDWAHMTPIQGDWNISSIGLPPEVLRKVYFDNARKLLARSLPLPVMKGARVDGDFAVDGDLGKAQWKSAPPVRMEYTLREGDARPGLSTEVRTLWSDKYVYFAFSGPYTKLTVFEPVSSTERLGLWDRDVVEVFIAPDAAKVQEYVEFEVAPTNERLDVRIGPGKKDFEWSSKFESAVRVDEARRMWTAEVRIPLDAIGGPKPAESVEWRVNLFRSDRENKAFLAWNPTLSGTTHAPGKFGRLVFGK